MKKTLVIIVIIVIATLLYTQRDNFDINQAEIDEASETGTFRLDPSSATFIFDNEEVTLSGGRNEGNPTPGAPFPEET
ncbi:MAG: hypothetical protein WD896_02340, partial [Parcubacteria group bacterium]